MGVVRGVGSEVTSDPADSLRAAEDLGRPTLKSKFSDYRIETPRSGRVLPIPGA